jgi:DNA-directed RNA polymerase subunit N (RpoN/RPB10)
MIYMKCPTCGTVIGNRQIIYEAKLKEIENNPNIDEDAKLEQKNKLINNLELNRYCCKMRVMTFKSMPLIIK